VSNDAHLERSTNFMVPFVIFVMAEYEYENDGSKTLVYLARKSFENWQMLHTDSSNTIKISRVIFPIGQYEKRLENKSNHL
jgi:hypothetical protein